MEDSYIHKRDALTNLLTRLDHVKQVPRMFIGNADVFTFILGYRLTFDALGLEWGYLQAYETVTRESNWKLNAKHPIQQMREVGMSESDIIAESLDLETKAIKLLLETLPDTSK